MLKLYNNVHRAIVETFSNASEERGIILGCTEDLEYIDCFQILPATSAGRYYYEPSPEAANEIIRRWQGKGICFCGFIHSHLVDKNDLSEDDIIFANRLLSSFKLPVLWFGIGVVNMGQAVCWFYAVSNLGNKITFSPIVMEIVE